MRDRWKERVNWEVEKNNSGDRECESVRQKKDMRDIERKREREREGRGRWKERDRKKEGDIERYKGETRKNDRQRETVISKKE